MYVKIKRSTTKTIWAFIFRHKLIQTYDILSCFLSCSSMWK